MYIKTEQVIREHPWTNKAGKQYMRQRTARIAHFQCDNCGDSFTKQVGNEVDVRRCNNSVSHYCRKCPGYALAAAKGKGVSAERRKQRWGEKRITDHGYVQIYVGDSYRSRSVYCGSIFEHALVAEKMLGRELTPGEVVHHIDGNKQNNDPSNLDVMTTEQHNLCHGRLANDLMFRLVNQGVIVYDRMEHAYRLGELHG